MPLRMFFPGGGAGLLIEPTIAENDSPDFSDSFSAKFGRPFPKKFGWVAVEHPCREIRVSISAYIERCFCAFPVDVEGGFKEEFRSEAIESRGTGEDFCVGGEDFPFVGVLLVENLPVAGRFWEFSNVYKVSCKTTSF